MGGVCGVEREEFCGEGFVGHKGIRGPGVLEEGVREPELGGFGHGYGGVDVEVTAGDGSVNGAGNGVFVEV